MSLITQEIPGLYNGVSQQPSSMRLDTQCELQENFLGTLTKGLIRRPGTKHVAVLTDSKADTTSFFHSINRAADEQYILIATGNDTEPLEVWNVNGTKATITYGSCGPIGGVDSGWTYQYGPDIDGTTKPYARVPTPSEAYLKYKAVTIADHTILKAMDFPYYTNGSSSIGDKDIHVFMGLPMYGWMEPDLPYPPVSIAYGGSSPVSSPINVLIWLKQTQLYCKMTFTVNGATYTHNVGSTIDDTSAVLAEVKAAIDGWTMPLVQTRQYGSILMIRLHWRAYQQSGVIQWPGLSVKTSDGWGETLMKTIQGVADKYTDLPPVCFNGYRVKITADSRGRTAIPYYVVFRRDGANPLDYNDDAPGTGTWVETRSYNIDLRSDLAQTNLEVTGFSGTTLPHSLTRVGLNSFQFVTDPWRSRQVGDPEHCPVQGFGGFTNSAQTPDHLLSGLYCFKNRLGLLYGDTTCLSRASDFFNLWPKTMLEVLDDDPIEISSGDPWSGYFRWAIPVEKQLVLFGDSTQQILSSGNDTLTPKSCSLDVATRFTCSAVTEPVPVGPNIYFMSGSSNYGHLMEYFVQPDGITTDAANVTSHCPHYLPGMDGKLAACLSENMIFFLPNNDRKSIYVYKFYWKGEEKLQSSWCKWTFDVNSILDIRVFGSKLYLIIYDGGNKRLERIDLDEPTIGSIPYQPALDSLVACTGAFNGTDTLIPLGYSDTSSNTYVVLDASGNLIPTGTKYNSTYCYIPGLNYHGQTLYCGKLFTSRYRFNEWFLKDGDGRVQLDARIQYRFLELVYNNTGYLKLEVTPKGRSTLTKEFSDVTRPDGKFRMLVNTDALGTTVDLVSTSHLPMEVQSATRTGLIAKKARSI